jgi:hypothetical protein
MANFTVTTTADSGAGSLRQAILDANANGVADTIDFDASLAGQTITLTSGQLEITDDVTITGDIDGDRKADITISGNNASRIFYISTATADVTLRSLTITEGRTVGAVGGAILSNSLSGSLTLIDSTVSDSFADQSGGGIYAKSQLNIVNSTISGNRSATFGGGLMVDFPAPVYVTNSTISGNSSGIDGGGISTANSGALNIHNTTITGNSSSTGGGIALFSTTSLDVVNSVVAGNNSTTSDPDVQRLSGAANVISATHSFLGTAVSIADDNGGNIVGDDPLLGALVDNGGPVMTRRPLANSPLVNAGSAAFLADDIFDLDNDGDTAELLPLDAAGRPRSSGSGLDIGAAEFINTAPTVTSGATFSVAENGAAVTTVTANDPDLGDTLNYSIAGGADAARFTINATTGALAFLAAPDFENPADGNGDNVYSLIVRATDLEGLFGQKAIAVTVTDVADKSVPPDIHDFAVGAVTVADTLAGLNGDIFKDFTSGDRITVSNVQIARKHVAFDAGTGVMKLDTNGDGRADATFNFEGERPVGDFMVVSAASGTHITFHRFLPELHEAVALAPQHRNGITNPDFLTGDGTRGFRVSLDPAAVADDTNALGVYEVTPDGRIVDARILFIDVKADPDAKATITGVEAGNRLGFFIVKTDADLVRLLPSAVISFVDVGGNAATASSDELFMLVNGGGGTKAMHSFSRDFNGFGINHAVSGVVPGGEAMEVAFEDTNLADGDLDFQDVVFTLDWVV